MQPNRQVRAGSTPTAQPAWPVATNTPQRPI